MRRLAHYEFNSKKLGTVFSILILLSPNFIMHYEINILNYAYFPLELLSIVYLEKVDNWKIRHWKFLLFIVFMEMIVFLPTFHEKRLSYSYGCMLIAEIFLVLHIINNSNNRMSQIIHEIGFSLKILWVIDVISVIFAKLSNLYMNDDFGFAGHKNNHAFLFVLCIGFELMNNIRKKEKILGRNTILISIISLFMEILLSSTSGVITVFIMCLVCFAMTKNKFKILNLGNIFVCLLAFNYVVIFAASQFTWIQNILIFMGKDISLSGRGNMWKLAIDLIKAHPFWGYGYSMPVTLWNVAKGGYVQDHCHNFFLNLALSGGIIYLIIVCVFVFSVSYRIKRNGDNLSMKVLTYTIMCYFLLGTSEIIVNVVPMLFPLLTIGYYSIYIRKYKTCRD